MAQSVFISYAREDDEPFVKRLHKDLTHSGFKVWWDRASLLWNQRPFRQEIADAICSHDRLILVVGPKAAVSDSVRQEWKWALALDKPIIPILRKGDYTHLPGELSVLQCDDFRDDGQYPAQLARLIENLRRPEPPLSALFGVPSLPPHFLARPDLLRQVKAALLADLKTSVVITGSDTRVGVHGMGGIGKSVLAVAIARDREVRRSYPDGIVWLTIGQQPNLITLQHDVARHLGSKEHFDTEPQGRGVLRQLLVQKAVLLVLDDVWQARATEAFDVLGPRCRALVTTRDAGILHTLGGPSVSISFLTEEQALQLLANAVGVESSSLPSEALEVVKECGYLPLAVAMCGSMVKKFGGDWTAILNRLKNADIDRIIDTNAIEERHRSIWRAMQVSVDALPSEEQQRFAELAVFVRANPVPEAAVATLWCHTGNLSNLDTTDLLINLADRSLIRLHQNATEPSGPIDRRISLHDLLYDFAIKFADGSKTLNLMLLDAYYKKCPNGWSTGPRDGYFFQYLAHHLLRAEHRSELRQLLLDYQWLEGKLEATDPNAVIGDFDLLHNDPELQKVHGAIRLSAHVLKKRGQLAGHLWGRLQSEQSDGIKSLLAAVPRVLSRPWLRPVTASLIPPGGPLVRTIEAHRDGVTAIVPMPDGSQVVSGSFDDTLKVWDLATGKAVHALHDNGCVMAVAVAPNGRYVVYGSLYDTVKVWDLAIGKIVRVLRGHQGIVKAVAVTPDGRYVISGSTDRTVRVWELASGRAIRTLADHEAEVNGVAVTPNGRYVVSVSYDQTLKVWDLETGESLRTLTGHTKSLNAVAITPDGHYAVSGSSDQTLRVWDIASGRATRTLAGHEAGVNAVAIAPDGRYVVSVSYDRTLRVWDMETGKPLCIISNQGACDAVAVTPNTGQVVSDGRDHTLKIWDIQKGKLHVSCETHPYPVIGVAVTPDGRHAISLSSDDTLKIWDLRTCRILRTYKGHDGFTLAMAVMPDNRHVISASFFRMLEVRDLQTGKVVRTLKGHTAQVEGVAVTYDGCHAVSGSEDCTLRVWDLQTGKSLRTLDGHEERVNAVAITPDGCCAVSGSDDHTLKVWDIHTGRDLCTIAGHTDRVYTIAVTPDGCHAVSGSGDRTLRVWDIKTGKAIHILNGHNDRVTDVAITADGCYVISGSMDQTLKVWDIRTGEFVTDFCGESGMLSCTTVPYRATIIAGDQSGCMHFLRLENVK